MQAVDSLKIPIILGQGARVVIAHENSLRHANIKIYIFSEDAGTMLRKIKVTPLAAESFGVRSMCTYIETPSLKVVLDAGVSICPNRFRLPPHPLEFKAIKEARQKIAESAEVASVVTLSHYHFDHYTPSYKDWLCNWTDADVSRQIYEDKLVLAKNCRVSVNASQRRRGWVFEKTGGKHAKKLEFADGKTYTFGETRLKFSSPVFHGLSNTPLGWLLMTTIEHEEEKVLFASDVQGPMDNTTLEIILAEKPQLLMIGGPPFYLIDFRVTKQQLQRGLKNLETLASATPIIILEHHSLRDLNWQDAFEQVFQAAENQGNKVLTSAEFSGKKNRLLEARRKQLFKNEPPDREFEKWYGLPESARRITKPPI